MASGWEEFERNGDRSMTWAGMSDLESWVITAEFEG